VVRLWLSSDFPSRQRNFVVVVVVVVAVVDSVGAMSLQDFMVPLTTFVVGWVVISTQGAFSWSVSAFCTGRAVVRSTAFDTCIGFVTVCTRMAVVLTSYALRDAHLVYTGWLEVNDPIL
jgi:hypothetical protein